MKIRYQIFLVIILFFNISCIEEEYSYTAQIETSEITDPRDGQTYKTVKIGSQWWMAENLNYSTSNGSWHYNNDSSQYSETYGRLYLYEAAMANDSSSRANPRGVQGVSPPGWHIPSEFEWIQLGSYLSNFNLNANDLKESGTLHWRPVNEGTNLAMFNAVPAGTVYNDGSNFANINFNTTFLTSTLDIRTGGVLGVGLTHNQSNLRYAPLGLENGWSLRCVKDQNH